MLLRNVFGKFLKDNGRGLIGWTVGLAAVTLLYTSFYPSMRDSGEAMQEYMRSLPSGLMEAMGWTDFSSAEGYLGATVFSLLGPVLTLVAAVMVGARAIAGDEEDGGLDLVLAHPVGRVRVLLERFAGLAVFIGVLGITVFAVLLLLRSPLDLGIGVLELFAASTSLTLVAFAYGTLALAVGAATGRRAIAAMAAAVMAVVGYLGNTFALQVEELEWLRLLSPFYYAFDHEPLVNGFDLGYLLVLLAIPAALIAIAASVFTRRDVAV
ncbi:ABC-2 type transport system permease protein [Spinactinospora alkalitolerans]|uniref:ABC-2 type transport system permease protein n=1 Tax=Spinactinospora alkalitolerans TaxID=687207 RepID=A0A852TQR0_9ACTN|nr:ABC transporter permease subunit [Spinactinospora alkalitolerans]NYE45915.1 ABC-2 type transport system permease protein [Spinactinospora alkalitolerans]